MGRLREPSEESFALTTRGLDRAEPRGVRKHTTPEAVIQV